jgi:hypothetical protein
MATDRVILLTQTLQNDGEPLPNRTCFAVARGHLEARSLFLQ